MATLRTCFGPTYESINTMRIGDKIIVIGERQDTESLTYVDTSPMYVVAFLNGQNWEDKYFSDSYGEIIMEFAKRIAIQGFMAHMEFKKISDSRISYWPITLSSPNSIIQEDNYSGKIIVIDKNALKQECRLTAFQLFYCEENTNISTTSEFSWFMAVNLYNGKYARLNKADILGVMPESALPDWAKTGLEKIRIQQGNKDVKSTYFNFDIRR